MSPKIGSLVDYMKELDIDIAAITETWLQDGSRLDRDTSDFENGTGLRVIFKNRKRRAHGRKAGGGGVAILCNLQCCTFKEEKLS